MKILAALGAAVTLIAMATFISIKAVEVGTRDVRCFKLSASAATGSVFEINRHAGRIELTEGSLSPESIYRFIRLDPTTEFSLSPLFTVQAAEIRDLESGRNYLVSATKAYFALKTPCP